MNESENQEKAGVRVAHQVRHGGSVTVEPGVDHDEYAEKPEMTKLPDHPVGHKQEK